MKHTATHIETQDLFEVVTKDVKLNQFKSLNYHNDLIYYFISFKD